jgi:hypothetical protein
VTTIRDRLAVSAAIVIVGLTAAAFWLSYAHLHTVAAAHGLAQSPARSWAWPATLDAFVVSGELLMLRASLARRTDWWAIGLTVTGSGGSIALNVFGVEGADPLAYVVAAVPPTAALLAFGALMRQIHALVAEKELPVALAHEAAPATPEPATATPAATGKASATANRTAARTSSPEPASPATATPPPAATTSPEAASPALPVAATPASAIDGPVYLPALEAASPGTTSSPAAASPEPAATPEPASPTRAAAKPAAGTDQRDLDQVADTYRKLAVELGRTPSDAKLADALGVGRSRAQQLRTAAIEAGHTDLAKPLRAAS